MKIYYLINADMPMLKYFKLFSSERASIFKQVRKLQGLSEREKFQLFLTLQSFMETQVFKKTTRNLDLCIQFLNTFLKKM